MVVDIVEVYDVVHRRTVEVYDVAYSRTVADTHRGCCVRLSGEICDLTAKDS